MPGRTDRALFQVDGSSRTNQHNRLRTDEIARITNWWIESQANRNRSVPVQPENNPSRDRESEALQLLAYVAQRRLMSLSPQMHRVGIKGRGLSIDAPRHTRSLSVPELRAHAALKRQPESSAVERQCHRHAAQPRRLRKAHPPQGSSPCCNCSSTL